MRIPGMGSLVSVEICRDGRYALLLVRKNKKFYASVYRCEPGDTLKIMQDRFRREHAGEVVLIDAIFIPKED